MTRRGGFLEVNLPPPLTEAAYTDTRRERADRRSTYTYDYAGDYVDFMTLNCYYLPAILRHTHVNCDVTCRGRLAR